MTEKRYKLANPNNLFKDMNIGIVENNTCMLKLSDVVELLNNLSDENERLKKQLKECLDAKKAYKDDWKACVSYCDTYEDEIYTYKDNIEGLKEENEQLKKDRFICLDCKYCGHTEIGCLCEKQDHWEDFKSECNDFKELKY